MTIIDWLLDRQGGSEWKFVGYLKSLRRLEEEKFWIFDY
jgi:hypothetical protein